MVLAPLVSQRKGEYKDVFAEARAEGFARVRVDGEIFDLTSEIKLNKKVKHTIEIVVDRLVMPARDAAPDQERPAVGPVGRAQEGAQSEWDAFVTRLTDSVEQALRVGEGQLIISIQNKTGPAEEWLMSEANTCTHCGISFPELSPQMFSFNSPQGACPECTGLGVRLEVDPLLLVPQPRR